VGGDVRDDFIIWRPSTGQWWCLYSSGGAAIVGWGRPGDYPLVGQVGGNAYDDFTLWRPQTGTWWVAYSDGSAYVSGYQWGLFTDVGM
jgi:hypothetical protein